MKLRGGGASLPDRLEVGWDGTEAEEGEFRDEEEPDEGGELFARPPVKGGRAPIPSMMLILYQTVASSLARRTARMQRMLALQMRRRTLLKQPHQAVHMRTKVSRQSLV